MKCKLPNQDAGTTMIFIADAMGDAYDPPGKEVREEDGVKFIEVQAEVGDALAEYGFEAMTEESTEDTTDDDSN